MNIPLSRITKDMTMTVKLTGTQRFKVGLWLFRVAVVCAAKIGGFGVKVERENGQVLIESREDLEAVTAS